MADQMQVSGAVEVDSQARVVWDMTREIATREKNPERESNPRRYYTHLYYECLQTAKGYPPK